MIVDITSKSNPKVRQVKGLLTSAKNRNESGLFVVEGLRLCVDAVQNGFKPVSVFYTENCLAKHETEVKLVINSADESYSVAEDVFKQMADTVTPQGILCVFEKFDNSVSFKTGGKYVVLMDLQDPSNLGAIARTAKALGIDSIIVCGGCDIYNPKALRASMGTMFRLSVVEMSEDKLFEQLKLNKIPTFATTPNYNAIDLIECDFSNGFALFIGNEGNGLSDQTIKNCDFATKIKMDGITESLNAAAAAAIVIYHATSV